MFIPTHLRIASRVMICSEIIISKPYKVALSIGSIIPDLFMFNVQHSVTFTWNKVQTYLTSLNTTKRGILRALKLGIVLHYVCDYFCRAHNDIAILHGMKHMRYERLLGKTFRKNRDFDKGYDIKRCSSFLKVLKSEHNKYIEDLTNNLNTMQADMEEAMKMGILLLLSYEKVVRKGIKNEGCRNYA